MSSPIEVAAYYDRTTPLYLEYGGTTLQAATLLEPNGDQAASTNLFLARRAGLEDGMHALDAGCGVAGPAMHIAAHFDVTIDAVTISDVQCATARALVDEHGLSERIHVHQGDYHCLPFPSGCFDLAYFFESAGHSEDVAMLFRETFRVLSPNGLIYIKDVFRNGGFLSAAEDYFLTVLNTEFHYTTPTLDNISEALTEAGFTEICVGELAGVLGGGGLSAFFDLSDDGEVALTPLGALHTELFRAGGEVTAAGRSLPVTFADIRATKPGPRERPFRARRRP